MPGSAPIVAALRRHPELDPRAVLAVAAQEGLGGGVGDEGTSFGPFQLHYGGAYPSSAPRGQQASHAWAWSPEGLEYALSRISGVAAGLKGGQAVRSIVSRFERPADPSGEITRALAAYGGAQTGGGAESAPTGAAAMGAVSAPGSNPRAAFAQQLLAAIGPTGQLNDSGLLGALQARRSAGGGSTFPGSGDGASGLNPGLPSGHGGIAELLREGTGGPTHSTGPHIHAAFTDPQLELAAIGYAQQHGLHVGENPYVGDTVDPVHAPNSFHGRNFPGLFNGRKLGQAIDVSGGDTSGFYKWLAARKR